LIADDDPGARLLQSTALGGGGFEIVAAEEGTQALELFQRHRPDCLVLDVVMPGLTGYDVCERIRALPEGRLVPILILTSLDDLESISRAYVAGATDFAQKGIAPLLLIERVRFLLRSHQLQGELLESEARLAEAQRIARLGHWELDLDGRTLFVSPVALDLLDTDREKAVDIGALRASVHADDRPRLEDAIRAINGNATRLSLDLRLVTPEGNERCVHMEWQLSKRSHGRGGHYSIITLQDLTDLRRAEERARLLAYFDSGTGLPNAAYLREQLDQSLEEAQGSEVQIAVVVVDIEHFNSVNDSLGAAAGDLLLTQIGQRLSQTLLEIQVRKGWESGRTPPLVARLGGDEFGLLVQLEQKADDLPQVVEWLQAAFTAGFNIEGREVSVGVTMGVAAYPDDAGDAEALLRLADAALHQAKQSARGGHHFYSANLQARAARRLSIESDLRNALRRAQFELHFQPRIALGTFAPTGVEALLRWRHPDRGLVSPGEFIPIAEEFGLIVDIGEWVFAEACRIAADWATKGIQLRTAVNVSAIQFQRASVPDQVEAALRAAQLSAHLLEVEITEGVLIEQQQSVRASLVRLRQNGVRIALDDFGTGYSSLSYLRRLPIDYLKIDRSFISGIEESSAGASLVSAILELARSLGLRTVAEGIETLPQLDYLLSRGCDEVQGFLLAKPMPPSQLEAWLADWLARPQGMKVPRQASTGSGLVPLCTLAGVSDGR
jgi:diguanylate cyclase (GGDEF)-like protein